MTNGDDSFGWRNVDRIPLPFTVTRGLPMGPLFTRPSGRVLMLWSVLAVLNISSGVLLSTHPYRVTDFETVTRWGGAWLVEGDPLYDSADSLVNYLPHGIVILSPLSVVPLAAAIPLWVLLNIGFACLAAYLAARFFRPHDSFKGMLLPILMFLTWGGVRTLTQFSLLALVCSMAALYLSDRSKRPAAGWLCVGMFKPQVALPVFLWCLFSRRWRVAMMSMLGMAVLTAVFCVRAQVWPTFVLERYPPILASQFTGHAILVGLSELRPLIQQFVTDVAATDVIAGSIALALLAAIVAAGFQEGGHRNRVLYAAPAFVACWSLLTFYHLTYGFVVLLPVMMLLALNDTERTMLRRSLFWLLQAGMMFDIPGLSRRLGLSGTAIYDHVVVHADRVLILILLVGLIVLAWREAPDGRERAHGL